MVHVLGHSFSQKRKCNKRPRDLHIRKVSFSGSSLSDGSLSSSTSTAVPHTPRQQTASLYPTSPIVITSPTQTTMSSSAPLRLHERAYKRSPPMLAMTTFYDDTAVTSDDEEEDEMRYYHYYEEKMGSFVGEEVVEVEGTQFFMELPPQVEDIKEDVSDNEEEEEEKTPVAEVGDYFFQPQPQRPAVLKSQSTRPNMPCSRWSESTIQTLDMEDDEEDDETPMADDSPFYEEEDDNSSVSSEEDEEFESGLHMASQVRLQLPPNFSHKYQRTVSAPEARRPPMRTMDSVDDFIKRGGWKRRGIVFDRREVGMRDSDTFTVI